MATRTMENEIEAASSLVDQTPTTSELIMHVMSRNRHLI